MYEFGQKPKVFMSESLSLSMLFKSWILKWCQVQILRLCECVCVCVGEGDGIILPQKCGSYTKASHPAGPEGPEEGGVTTAMAESRKLEMT